MIVSVGVLLGQEAIAPVVNVVSTCCAIAGDVVCALVRILRRRDPGTQGPFVMPGGLPLVWAALLSSIGLIRVSHAGAPGARSA